MQERQATFQSPHYLIITVYNQKNPVLLRAGFFLYSDSISAFRFIIVFHQLIDFFLRSVFFHSFA